MLDGRGEVMLRRRLPTPQGDYGGTVSAIRELVASVEADAGSCGRAIGVGIPGSPSPRSGLIRNANSTVLNGRPLRRDLAEALDRPVSLTNDANCFALAEAVAGAGQGARVVLGVILGTGVGAGIAIGAGVLAGADGIAGEWGHTPLPAPADDERPGPACWCGRRGCVEAWLSGPALAADHARHGGEAPEAGRIAAAAADGDKAAQRTLARHRERLGRALAVVINILDPDVIVLGGGLSNLAGLAEALPDLILPHVFSDGYRPAVRRNALGDSAGVIGAAWSCAEADEGPSF